MSRRSITKKNNYVCIKTSDILTNVRVQHLHDPARMRAPDSVTLSVQGTRRLHIWCTGRRRIPISTAHISLHTLRRRYSAIEFPVSTCRQTHLLTRYVDEVKDLSSLNCMYDDQSSNMSSNACGANVAMSFNAISRRSAGTSSHQAGASNEIVV